MKLETADAIELRLIEDADLGTPCRIGARQIVAQRRLGDRRQQQFAEPPLGKGEQPPDHVTALGDEERTGHLHPRQLPPAAVRIEDGRAEALAHVDLGLERI